MGFRDSSLCRNSACKLLIGLYVTALVVFGFPDSADPIVGEPPLNAPSKKSCSVNAIVNAPCDNYNLVFASPFSLPLSDCPSELWSEITLHLESSINGTQYDRFGAVWINDIEVLRLTTPEPNPAGIVWGSNRDISYSKDYMLEHQNNLTMYLTIPNNVDSTYNGVFLTSITLIVSLKEGSAAAIVAPSIVPLTSAATFADGYPWDAMQVVGDQALTYSLSSVIQKIGSQKGADGLYVDIFASAHGCEEFYYSNVPSENASSLGFCGGGVYRELNVFIDGIHAGSTYPFPVLYSGGVNPFLWRPAAGIVSFNIPPHRIDISPFIGYLMDGNTHSISLSVFNNNDDGFWYLDASVLITTTDLVDQVGQPVIGSGSVTSLDSTPVDSVQTSVSKDSITFDTVGSHDYEIEGSWQTSDGKTVKRHVSGSLRGANSNKIIGSTTGVSAQGTVAVITSTASVDDKNIFSDAVVDVFPLALENYYGQDDTTMELQAAISYDYRRARIWGRANSNGGTPTLQNALSWSNKIQSSAEYNRSLDHSTVFIETGTAGESFVILSNAQYPGENCYERNVLVNDGNVIRDVSFGDTVSCGIPSGLYFCGIDVCGKQVVIGKSDDISVASFTDKWLQSTSEYLDRNELSWHQLIVSDLVSLPLSTSVSELKLERAPSQARYRSSKKAQINNLTRSIESLMLNDPLDATIFKTPVRNPRSIYYKHHI